MSVFSPPEVEVIKSIKAKILSYLKEIEGKHNGLLYFLKHHAILTGGCISSHFHGEEVKDYDFYLKGYVDIDVFKEKYALIGDVEDVNPNYGIETEVEGKLITANAITFKDKIQVITMADCNAREQFDFVHCMPYIVFNPTEQIFISREQFDCIMHKKLKMNPKYEGPVQRHRYSKYREKGWTV